MMGAPSVDVTVEGITVDLDGLDKIGLGGTGTPLDVSATIGGTSLPVGVELGGTKTPVGVQVDGSGTLGVTLGADVKVAPVSAEADVTARLKELAPLFFNFLWKEIPLVKVAAPHRYKLGFHIFNIEFFSIRLCGESEVITERNVCQHETGAAKQAGPHA